MPKLKTSHWTEYLDEKWTSGAMYRAVPTLPVWSKAARFAGWRRFGVKEGVFFGLIRVDFFGENADG
jgi:hypothetical protein